MVSGLGSRSLRVGSAVGKSVALAAAVPMLEESICHPLDTENGETLLHAEGRICAAGVEGVGYSLDGIIGGGQLGADEDWIIEQQAREYQLYLHSKDRIMALLARLEAIEQRRSMHTKGPNDIYLPLIDPLTGWNMDEMRAELDDDRRARARL